MDSKQSNIQQTYLFDFLSKNIVSDEISKSPFDLLNFSRKSNMIKTVKTEPVCYPNQFLYDISMNSKGIDEDESYINDFSLIKNIRRGNTIIEHYNYDSYYNTYSLNKTEIARRGMSKFFDLSIEFVEANCNHRNTIEHITDQQKQKVRKIIFGPIIRALKEGKKVEIIKSIKANGENAQISYNSIAKSWIIASKNVSLIAKSRKELEEYNPQKIVKIFNKQTHSFEEIPVNYRYNFSYLIGLSWFEKLSKFSPEKLEELKKFLSGKTMIGEYVGNQNAQHLIRYNRVDILFYSIVVNESPEICLNFEENMKIFKKFDLNTISYEKIGEFTNYDSLCECLENLYIRIAQSSIIEEEEGSVVYISSRGEKGEGKVVSMFKLKTLEYRVYRKLREKLKNHLQYMEDRNVMNSRMKITQFFNEILTLAQGFKLPHSTEFYCQIAENAFEFLNQNSENCKNLQNHYIDFLEAVFLKMNSNTSLKSRMMNEENVLTVTNLVQAQKSIEAFKSLEIFVFCPPGIFTDETFSDLEKRLNCKIFNSLDQKDTGINISNNILYLIHGHGYKEFEKIEKNMFLYFIGFNEVCFAKSLEYLSQKLKNTQFITYNQHNKSLIPFISEKNNLEVYLRSFLSNSLEYIKKIQNNSNASVKVIESIKDNEFITEIENCFSILKELNKSKDLQINLSSSKIEEEAKTNKSIVKENKIENNQSNSLVSDYSTHVNKFTSLTFDDSKLLQNQKEDKYEFSCEVLIPMTIPGTGKTSFVETLKEIVKSAGIDFDCIGSDKIRKKLMDDFMKKSQKITQEEAFDKTGKDATREFDNILRKKIRDQSENKNLLFYIDKNHPPNALSRTFKNITESFTSSKNLKFIALVPDCKYHFRIDQNIVYPFSLSYFIQCYLRVKKRRNHETLNGDKPIMNIFGMFFNNFMNFKIDSDNLLGYYQFDKVIKLPFTDEVEESELPVELVNLAKIFFKSFKSGQTTSSESKELIQFEEAIMKYASQIKFKSTIDLVKSTAIPIIKNIFNKTDLKKDKSVYIQKSQADRNHYLNGKKVIFLGLQIGTINRNFNPEIEILNFIDRSMNVIKSKYNENSILDFHNEIWLDGFPQYTRWKYPPTWHVTTLYIGGDESKKKNEIYQDFKMDEIVDIELVGLIFVPKKILTCICFPKYKIENKIPHLTTLIQDWQPKQSKIVLEEYLLDTNGKMKKEYEEIFKNQNYQKNFVEKKVLKISENEVTTYICRLKETAKFIGKAKYY